MNGEILSLYGLMHNKPDMLDGLHLPVNLDPDMVKERLQLDTLELEILYTDPDMLAKAIEIWSRSRVATWERMYYALTKDYDPFINFTRDERRERTDTHNLQLKETRDLDGSSTNSGTDTTTASGRDNTAATLIDRTAERTQHGRKIETEDNGTITTDDTGTLTSIETFHSQGDSALYTPTDVARKEVELRAEYDIINIIVQEFKARFCLCVY